MVLRELETFKPSNNIKVLKNGSLTYQKNIFRMDSSVFPIILNL